MPIDPQLGPNRSLIGVAGGRRRLSTPALLIDLDRLERNIEVMAGHLAARGQGLRPVAKIHKSVEIARRQVAAGALGVCCATLAEAETMVDGGIGGVLLFSSVTSEAKIARLAALNARAEDFMVAVDDAGNAAQLAAAAARAGRRLKVLVDYEVGGRRTGLASLEAALDLAQRVAANEWLEFAGVQGYSGRDQRMQDFGERAQSQAEAVAPLRKLCERLGTIGLAPGIVTGGGTGTHDIDHTQGVFTECQAGTYVFMDVNYLSTPLWRDDPTPFETALFVRTSVISTAQPGFAITDAGVKEFARAPFPPEIVSGAPPDASYDLVGDDLGRINFARPDDTLQLGDAVECITPQCYATLNLYNVYHCVRGDTLVAIWPIDARATW
jgi:D-serine deaminase-like pyridoxal phosphate-dependent protein